MVIIIMLVNNIFYIIRTVEKGFLMYEYHSPF